MWHAYLLRCLDGTTYTGIAIDVDARFAAHACGSGGHYTRAHSVEAIIAAVPIGTRAHASRFERVVKRWKPVRKLKFFQPYANSWREYCTTRDAPQLRTANMIDLQEALCVHAATAQQLTVAENAVWSAIQKRVPALADAIRQAGLDDQGAARWVCFPIEELVGSPAHLIARGDVDQVLAYVLRVTHQLAR